MGMANRSGDATPGARSSATAEGCIDGAGALRLEKDPDRDWGGDGPGSEVHVAQTRKRNASNA